MPTFETPGPILVTLDLPHGSVRVLASDRADTCVTVAGDGDTDGEPTALVEFADGELLVKGPGPRRFGWALDRLRGGPSLDVHIELPAGSRLNGALAMGNFRCEGRLGECTLVTRYGDIRFDEGGPLQLATKYGDVHLDHALGHADLSTGAGDVRARALDGTAAVKNNYGETRVGEVTGDLRVAGLYGEVRVDRAGAGVEARTAYGSVRINDVARGVVDLATTSGELEIGVREGSAAWLDVSTASGRIRTSLDAHDSPDGFADTVEIRARTHDGDIVVRRA